MTDELQRLRDQNARLKERLTDAERERDELRASCANMIDPQKAESLKAANTRLRESLLKAERECRHLRGRR